MNIDRAVFRFAGFMVLLTLLLSVIHTRHWLWFTAFVGINLIQASFTGFCPIVKILKTFGIKPGKVFD